jgi:hypothetical protein
VTPESSVETTIRAANPRRICIGPVEGIRRRS